MKSTRKKLVAYSDWWYPDSLGGAESSARSAMNLLARDLQIEIVTIRNKNQPKVQLDSDLLVYRVRVPIFRRSANVGKFVKYLERLRLQFDLVTPALLALKIYRLHPSHVVLHNIDRSGPLMIMILKIFAPHLVFIRVFHDLGDSCLIRSRFRSGKVCSQTCTPCKPREFVHKKVARWYSHCVVVSEFALKKLVDLGFVFSQVSVGYPLTNMNKTVSITPLKLKTEAVLRVGYLGRISDLKGIGVLFEACKIISETRKVQVVLFGDGNQRYISKMKKYAEIHRFAVSFNSATPNAKLELRGEVDLVVVPSSWEEPFGKVPLESIISVNVPVVVSNSGGLPESKNFIDSNMYIFNSESADDLATKILTSKYETQTNIVIERDRTLYYQLKKVILDEVNE